MVSVADAVIGISGCWGTLSELSLALNLNKPVIIIQNTGGVVDWFVNIPIGFAEHRYLVANDAYDAVRLAFSLIE